LVSVDCIDCKFQQIRIPNPTKAGTTMINKNLYSKKFSGPALRYEIATSLKHSDIVWVSGPHLPGMFNDLQIFRMGLKHMLEPNERVRADKIYGAEAPKYVKCPGMVGDLNRDFHKRVEGRHELGNSRLKIFGCLTQRYKGTKVSSAEKIRDHGSMFVAVCVITQVAMELGFRELFEA